MNNQDTFYHIIDSEKLLDMKPEILINQHNQAIYNIEKTVADLLTHSNLSDEDENFIRLMNINLENLLQDNKKINYKAWHIPTEIGYAELWGKRKTQEDRVCVGLIPEFLQLHANEIEVVLRKTVAILQDTLVEKGIAQHQGSTLCVVIQAMDQLYVVNVGDSAAYLVTLNNETKTQLLTPDLHQPLQPKEISRLHSGQFQITNERIGGVLALSRALGDNFFEKHGLIHEPDIYQYQISNATPSYVVVSCDGLTENNVLSTNKIGEIIAAHKDQRTDEIAYTLATSAYERGSEDNISVIVMPTTFDTASFAAVFDGHGGDEVSATLAAIFLATLNMAITFTLMMRK